MTQSSNRDVVFLSAVRTPFGTFGGSLKDVVHVFIFRTRPRMGDIGISSRVVNSYFAPHNHKPTTTNMAVLELGEPEQLIEIQVVAVVD